MVNTILTDDERREIHCKTVLACNPVDALIQETEAAVLAKLREQEPVAWQWRKKGGDWTVELTFVREVYATTQDTEVRPLYADPLPAVAREAKLTVDDLRAEFEKQHQGKLGLTRIEGGEYLSPALQLQWDSFLRGHFMNAAPGAEALRAPVAPAPHPDDAAVDAFAQAMKDKLAAARAKGRDGWQTCPPETLSRMLREHVEKGDPRDVANFAMFLWSLGHGIAAAPQPAVVQEPQAFADWLCREMPPGTVISDPAWWAPRIARAMLAAAPEAPATAEAARAFGEQFAKVFPGAAPAAPATAVSEREAFEAHEQAKHKHPNDGLTRYPDAPDQYALPLMQARWEGWQARAALARLDALGGGE